MFSRVFIRSASTGVEARQAYENFLQYVKTPHDLRPYIYRKKNAHRLLVMDLKDPVTKQPLQPREPVTLPGTAVLNEIVLKAQTQEELEGMILEWRKITPRRKVFWNYFTGQHLQNLLLVSTFKFGSLSKTLNGLYQLQPLFVKAKNLELYDVENWYNSVLMCQLHRNEFENVKDQDMVARGLRTLSRSLTKREDITGLAKELVSALGRQQGVTVSYPKFCINSTINLPNLDVESSNPSQLAVFINKNRSNYLLSRTVLHFGSSDAKVQDFVTNYQQALKRANKLDLYDANISSYKALLESRAPKQEEAEQEVQSVAEEK